MIWLAPVSSKRAIISARLSRLRSDSYSSRITSGRMTATGSSPTTGCAHSTAWPRPFANPWRTCIIVTCGGQIDCTSSRSWRFTRFSSMASSSKLVSKWFSIEFLEEWVTSTISVIPAAIHSFTTYWIKGLSTSGNISLGIALVAGNILVPNPATGITAFLTFELRAAIQISWTVQTLNLLVN